MADRKPFLLRIDEKLWRDLEAWAQEDLRSVNGQIEFDHGKLTGATAGRFLRGRAWQSVSGN